MNVKFRINYIMRNNKNIEILAKVCQKFKVMEMK